ALGRAQVLADQLAAAPVLHALDRIRKRAEFLDGFETRIFPELRRRAHPAQGSELGPAARVGAVLDDGAERLVLGAAVDGPLVASIGSRATAHGRSSFVGADLDVREVLEQLRAEVAWLHSNTDARLAIVDAAGLTIGGDDGLAAVASSAEGTALGEGLGWRVLAAPRDPEAS